MLRQRQRRKFIDQAVEANAPGFREAAQTSIHLVELAVAGGAQVIVTNNLADFRLSGLRFPNIRVAAPKDLLKELG